MIGSLAFGRGSGLFIMLFVTLRTRLSGKNWFIDWGMIAGFDSDGLINDVQWSKLT